MSFKVTFCKRKAAEYAVSNWHYSKSLPAGKLFLFGVYEDEDFIGCVIYSRGANINIGKPYNLQQTEVCELTRVALNKHKTPVTQIISITLKLLAKNNPGLKLVVSYADVDQGHEGIIYKAGNWIYEGLLNAGNMGAFIVNKKKMHPKSVHSKWGTGSQNLNWLQKNIDPNAKKFITKGKHKFLYPLDKEWYISYNSMREKHKSNAT